MGAETSYRGEFVAAVWCFLLAAVAGVVMRTVGAGFQLPAHIDFSNLRRAHSHLMLFAWVTPALGALIASHVGDRPVFRASLRAMLVLGVLSFPSFLIWGYDAAVFGSARVPISVIISTASMFAWYAFAVEWWRVRSSVRHRVGALATRCWDGALALLVLGSLGAWARGALIGMKIDDPFLTNAVIEFFLTGYADGFLLLGTLGLLFASMEGTPTRKGSILRAVLLLAIATPFEFLALLRVDLVAPELRVLGSVAVAICAIAALRIAWHFRRRLAGLLLAVLAAGKLLLVHPTIASDVMGYGLRIPYLHVLLLGLVTLTLFDVASSRWQLGSTDWIRVAVLLSLVALLPTTGLWPAALGRDVGLLVTACAAALPVAAVAVWAVERPSTRCGRTRRPSRPRRAGRSPSIPPVPAPGTGEKA